MGSREEAITQMTSRLKEIKTLDDFKEAHDEIISLMENVLKSALTVLQDFLGNMFSLEPGQVQDQASQFQEKDFIFSDEIEKELERIHTIPGADEFSAGFDTEMEVRLGPFMEELSRDMGTMMENLMSGFAGGIAEAFGGSGGQDEPEYEEPERFSEQLYYLYDVKTLDELNEMIQALTEQLGEQLQYDIWDLEIFMNNPNDDFVQEDKEKVEIIRARFELLMSEIEKEFSRIAQASGSEKEVLEIKKNLLAGIKPKTHGIRRLLAK